MVPMFARLALPIVALAACVKQLPPAPTPQPVAPAVRAPAPPAAGQGRVIVDVVDGPTPVYRVDMPSEPIEDADGRVRFRFGEREVLACEASPCALDLPLGNAVLGFPVIGKRSLEIELVHVADSAAVYRRTLSVYQREDKGAAFVLGIIGASLGGAAVITGATLAPIGLGRDNIDLAFAGGITLAAGAVLTTLGVLAIRSEADVYRPGSSIHFPL